MSEQKDTLDWFIRVAQAVRQVASCNSDLFESIMRDKKEIDKLNSIIDELRDENESLKSVNREMSEDLMRIAEGGDA